MKEQFMDKIITTLEVVMPIVTAVGLGMLARRKNLITAEGIGGFQPGVFCGYRRLLPARADPCRQYHRGADLGGGRL